MLLCIAPPGKCCHFPGKPHQSWNGFPESLGVPISWKIWDRPSSTSTATTNFWMVCQHLGRCWKTFSSSPAGSGGMSLCDAHNDGIGRAPRSHVASRARLSKNRYRSPQRRRLQGPASVAPCSPHAAWRTPQTETTAYRISVTLPGTVQAGRTPAGPYSSA